MVIDTRRTTGRVEDEGRVLVLSDGFSLRHLSFVENVVLLKISGRKDVNCDVMAKDVRLTHSQQQRILCYLKNCVFLRLDLNHNGTQVSLVACGHYSSLTVIAQCMRT
jgi:hypothetical protein